MDFPTVSQTIDSSMRPMLFPQEGSGAADILVEPTPQLANATHKTH